MPRKYTLDELHEIIEKKFNNEVELLSSTYVNAREPMDFKCKCGNVFSTNFTAINQGHIQCHDCANKEIQEKTRFDFCHVLDIIRSCGCEYVDGEYINSKTKLLLRCQCGNLFERDLDHLQRGRNTCFECRDKKKSKEYRADIEDVKRRIEELGCEYVSGEYINNHSKLVVKCACGKPFVRAAYKILFGQIHCDECVRKIVGDSKRKYLIAESPSMVINIDLRKLISPWRNKMRELYNNKCPITGSTNIAIHHLISFSKIYYDSIQKYPFDYDLNTNITIIPSTEIYNQIKQDVLESHTLDIGIAIDKNIHNKFHSEYGVHDNTPEQFDEFLRKNYNTTLEAIQIVS